jgi:hypothetical protein
MRAAIRVGGPALAVALAAAAAMAGGRVFSDFEAMETGEPPAHFTTALTGQGGPVEWIVREDTTAPSGPKVLVETSADGENNRFPLAILDGIEAKDVEVSVRFRPVAGRIDQAAGLMVRVRDPDNYYVARANALENNVRLYRVVNGKRRQFAGTDAPVPKDRWQLLTLRIQGNRLAVGLNGKTLFHASDDTFPEAGRVGLWTKADSVTHFDALTVTSLP